MYAPPPKCFTHVSSGSKNPSLESRPPLPAAGEGESDRPFLAAGERESDRPFSLAWGKGLGDGGRFLAVVGPSGSGKSSVVRAGLIPALRQGGLPGSEQWFIAEFIPGAHPLEELELALLKVAVRQPAGLAEQLQRDERGLARAARLILPDDDSELVVVIDQFEEMFTLVADESARAHLLDSLIAAVTDERSHVRVIVTLRADFYDRPLRYPKLGELMRARTEVVLPLNPDDLEQAIVEPARRAGVTAEPELVADVVRDVGAQPGALPLLQYALTEIFERRERRVLTRAAYRASGGVRGALARRAEELYQGLDPAGQAAAREIFLRLVTLGEGVEDTRRRALWSELVTATNEDTSAERSNVQTFKRSNVQEMIDAYGKHRLLTFDHDPVTRAPTVEVAHEALIREWPRLRTWLDASRGALRTHRLLAAAVAEWDAAAVIPASWQLARAWPSLRPSWRPARSRTRTASSRRRVSP